MKYVTIEGVELITVGMDWPAAAGDITFTFEHLDDAMRAANDDPHIVPPRLALGHVDPRFATAEELDNKHNPFYDGEPSFGVVRNLRLENDGAVLVGDFEEVPSWLAESLPSSYPNRSSEGAFLDGQWKVETPGGKEYSFVLTRVALLGVYRPAVLDLEDLQRLLVEGEGLVVTGDGGAAAAAKTDDVKLVRKKGAQLSASIDKVVQTFWEDFATEEEGRYWWWPRDIWTDPNQIVADDNEGGLWLIPFSSDGDQQVSFSDAQKVLETFVPAPAEARAALAAAASGREGEPAASFASRAEAGRDDAPEEGGAAPSGRTSDMDEGTLLRQVLGLGADATDEEVEAAAAEQQPEPTPDPEPAAPAPQPETPPGDPAPSPEPEPSPEPSEPEPAPDPEAQREPVTAGLPEGMVAVPLEQWQQVQAGAQAGAQLASSAEEERRDSTIEAALGKGKIAPSQRESLVNLHGRDADAFYTLLTKPPAEGGLAENIVPVRQRGTSKDPVNAGADSSEMLAIGASFGQDWSARSGAVA